MLDKLVESNVNQYENKKLRKLLLTISTIAVGGVIFALVFSLFTQNLAMGQEISISSLLTPAAIPTDAPPKPEPEKASKQQIKTNIITAIRKVNMSRMDESPTKVPANISVSANKNKERPNSLYEVGLTDSSSDQTVPLSEGSTNGSTASKTDFGVSTPEKVENEKPKSRTDIPKPPPLPAEVIETKRTIISGGVVNGKALNLSTPVYSPAAKQAGIHGRVTVQVLIDENGKVVSANVVDGHPLLRTNAVNAARKSTFSPTFLSGNKVKVSGVIIYNFN